MRKKFLTIAVTAALMASLGACSNNSQTNESSKAPETSTEEVKSTEDTKAPSDNDAPSTEEAADSSENTEDTADNTEAPSDDNASDSEAKALEAKLVNKFKEEIAKGTDILEIAKLLADEDFTGYSCEAIEVEEGYLPGFDEDVKGFKRAVNFGPIIGTIPFVGYIFEVDDAESFKAELESIANPRWNICTEANEPVFEIYENYVFVTMVPMDDDYVEDPLL